MALIEQNGQRECASYSLLDPRVLRFHANRCLEVLSQIAPLPDEGFGSRVASVDILKVYDNPRKDSLDDLAQTLSKMASLPEKIREGCPFDLSEYADKAVPHVRMLFGMTDKIATMSALMNALHQAGIDPDLLISQTCEMIREAEEKGSDFTPRNYTHLGVILAKMKNPRAVKMFTQSHERILPEILPAHLETCSALESGCILTEVDIVTGMMVSAGFPEKAREIIDSVSDPDMRMFLEESFANSVKKHAQLSDNFNIS